MPVNEGFFVFLGCSKCDYSISSSDAAKIALGDSSFSPEDIRVMPVGKPTVLHV
jgi:hypothetical protein